MKLEQHTDEAIQEKIRELRGILLATQDPDQAAECARLIEGYARLRGCLEREADDPSGSAARIQTADPMESVGAVLVRQAALHPDQMFPVGPETRR